MAEQQWYMALRGHQIGPVGEAEVISNIRNRSVDANTYAFGSGMSRLTRLKDVPHFPAELAGKPRLAVPTLRRGFIEEHGHVTVP